MRKSKIKQISLAVCLAFMPFTGYAAGLGKLNVNSGLGEPLKADIELLSVTPEELSSLVAVIASEDAYATQGITRLSIHNNIKVEIAKNPDGSPILKLRSTKPISDPYLDMLIQVDWATGRLQREYTILLDPPGYNQAVDSAAAMPVTQPSAKISDVASRSSQASSSNLDTAKPNIKKSRKQPRIAAETPPLQKKVAENVNVDDVTTKRGDTLSSIARDMQVEGVNLDQMLVGLYENNKDAFLDGNMNRLKVGQIIKVPTKESLTSIGVQQAKQSIKIHSTNWNVYRNTLAASVERAPTLVETEQKQSGSGKIAAAEDKATPAKVGPQDVVKLSAGEKDASKTVKDASKAFDAKIVALQEETSAREKSLKEAKERTAALEKQIQDMQKLLALKSQSMAQLQKNAETVAKAPDVKMDTEELVKAQATPAVAVAPEVEIKPLEKVPALIPEIKKVKPTPHAQTLPEPKPEPSFLEGLMNSVDLVVLGGAAGVALLGAGWMFLRNKRKKDLDSFERGILTSGGLRANTVFGNTTGNASTSDTSFLTDFSQNADGSMIDTNDVDPIAEAEVYMAYGRDAQAEEILKDAISKEPKRYELHLKLLEMYAGRKETAAFETIAGELYTTLGANNPIWGKVAEMGAVLEPENPLYVVSNIASSDALTTDALTTQKLDLIDFSTPAVTADSDLDFSFNTEPEAMVEDANSAVMQSFSEAKDDGQEISFDLGTLNAGADSASLDSTDTGKSIVDSIPEDVISFERADANQPVEESLASHNAFSPNTDADNSLDFDLGDLTTEVPVEGAPVQSAVLDVANDTPAFDAAMISNDSFSAPTAESESADSESPDFDLDFMLPTEDVKNELEHQPEVASNALDDISFDLDFALDEPVASTPVVSMPVKQADNDGMEISFDLPDTFDTNESVTSNSSTSQENNHEANTFDLSSISLDLGETESELFNEVPSPVASAEPEPQDVNVKLDLVAAYIDMDDKEGARELLDEVMKEGGSTQKARAQQLLDSLA